MKNEIVEKLALIYVQAHTDAETAPEQMYDLYQKAVREIRDAESTSHNITI